MLVITKNTNAQWRLGNWCVKQRLDAPLRTLDAALAQAGAGGWSVVADPGFPALVRGAQAFAERNASCGRLRLVFVGTCRPRDDASERRHFEALADLVWVTHVAWPSRSRELHAIFAQGAAPPTYASLASVVHELATPLATLRGWCEALVQPAPDPFAERAATALPVMRRSVSQLERLVAELRDVERLKSGAFALEFTLVDVNAIAKLAVDGVLPLANEKGVSVNALLAPEAPRIRGDETRLLQLLHNLLANSLRFTRSDGRIDVSVLEGAGFVTLSVGDTGTGLSTAESAQLFTRSLAHTRAPLRSGLGLMIAREIVERHRGQIRAESRGENQGTLVTVTLPMATSD